MQMGQDTLVDTTLITVHSYTRNKAGKRDLEMHLSKKANQRYFGM
jgi:IS5 family transposase